MNVKIEIIPHEQHRYTTVGDWFFDASGDLTIQVSKLSDWRREMLVAIHELVEVVMCRSDGISQAIVDDFDMNKFKYSDHPDEEPGDQPYAPYRRAHCVATGIERIMASELCVNWKPYEEELEALPEIPEKE